MPVQTEYMCVLTTILSLPQMHPKFWELHSVEHIMTFSMSSSHNVVIACENSTVLHFHKIGYVRLYNLKFRGCQFAVRRVDNFYLVNVEITDLTATFTTALQLIQVNTNIKNSFFSRIITNFGAVGGIIGANQSNVTIKQCMFEDNRVYNGKAFFSGQNSNIVVIGSTFTNMELIYGADYPKGGIFHLNEKSSAIICNSTFFNNAIRLPSGKSFLGGIIVTFGNLNITSCYFINNYNIGAVHVQGDNKVNIERSVFTNNSALYGAVYVSGGEVSISKCLFTANIALNFGGAIHLLNEATNISRCIFQKNYGRKGGGIALLYDYNNATKRSIIISMSDFGNNTVIDEGGAIYLDYGSNNYIDLHCIVIECRFINNTAKLSDGGAVYVSYKTIIAITIQKSFFAYNSAIRHHGGALCVAGVHTTTVNISGCVFTDNKAYSKGGALHAYCGKLFMIDNELNKNEAASGGALFVDLSELLNLLQSNFSNNNVIHDSGGTIEIQFHEQYATFPWIIGIGKNIFRNNIATEDGGSINFFGSSSNIDSDFSVLIFF